MKFLLVFLVACSSTPVLPATAVEQTEQSCQRALAGLRADRDAGVSCDTAKRRAAEHEPLCPLTFHCPSLDGGAE